jgi:hypothetical protein
MLVLLDFFTVLQTFTHIAYLTYILYTHNLHFIPKLRYMAYITYNLHHDDERDHPTLVEGIKEGSCGISHQHQNGTAWRHGHC